MSLAVFATSRAGRAFAAQLVAARLTELDSMEWVEQLGMRCPFILSHAVLLSEQLHAQIAQFHRQRIVAD